MATKQTDQTNQNTKPAGKTIILCFDGTTNQYGANTSNIAKLYEIFAKDKPDEQVSYYQPGLGQYFTPGTTNFLTEPFFQTLDWMFAWNLPQHIIDGYRFLVQNWKDGDKVLIFGFSRGAYTARCVAGMVSKVGLIAKDNHESLMLAYRLYEHTGIEGTRLSERFKRTFSRTVPIDFVGCFDTVASVGPITEPNLPFTNTNSEILRFRHALALDERRVRFQMSLFKPVAPQWGVPTGFVSIPLSQTLTTILWGVKYAIRHPSDFMTSMAGKSVDYEPSIPKWTNKLLNSIAGAGLPADAARKRGKDTEPEVTKKTVVETDVKEVWFSGCHEDIGGCAVQDDSKISLGDITLRWMVKEVIDSGLGVKWCPIGLKRVLEAEDEKSVTPDKIKELDALDVEADVHDSLELKSPASLVWWFIELGPDRKWLQGVGDTWFWQFGINAGRARRVFSRDRPYIHESVHLRQTVKDYWPQAVFVPNFYDAKTEEKAKEKKAKQDKANKDKPLSV